MARAVISPSPGGSSDGGADVVADKNGFQGDGGLGALMGGDFGVQSENDFLGGGGAVVQIGKVAEDFMGDVEAGFQALGGAEIGQEAALQGDFLELVNDRVGFFEGDLEMAVLLEFAFGGFPPFLPVVLDDIGDEDLLDLVHGGAVAEALQDQFDQIQMMQGGHLAEGCRDRKPCGRRYGPWQWA